MMKGRFPVGLRYVGRVKTGDVDRVIANYRYSGRLGSLESRC